MPTIKPKQTGVASHLTITRPDQLQALGDGTRWRILGRLLDGPASIQELAKALGVARGTIGHHVGVLDEAGLIRLVETHRVRGVVEKRYARVAWHFRLKEGSRSSPATADPRYSHLPLRQALAEARPETGQGRSVAVGGRPRPDVGRTRAPLRPPGRGAGAGVRGRGARTGETFGFVAAIYVPDWSTGEAGEEVMSLERAPREESQSELAAVAPKRGSLWRHGDFMKLWTGQTISQLGDEVTQLAIPLVAALTLEVTPLRVRPARPSSSSCPSSCSPSRPASGSTGCGGEPILIGANLGRAALLTSIPVAFVGGWLTIWQLYVVAFAIGCLEVFFDVAYQSYLPSVVERDRLVEGNAKLELSVSATMFVGPTVAGFLADLVRPAIAIVFDVASYLGSIVFLLLHPTSGDAARGARPGHRATPIHAAGGGRGPALRARAPLPALHRRLHRDAQPVRQHRRCDPDPLPRAGAGADSAGTIGIVLTIGNLGVLARRPPLGASRSLDRRRSRPSWGPRSSPSFALIAVALAPREAPVPFLIAGGFIGTVTAVVYNVNQVSLRQAITPDRMLGRMNATMRFIVWGTIPIGALVGGVLGGVIGLQATIWVGAIGAFLGFLPVLLSPVRSLKEIPSSEPA